MVHYSISCWSRGTWDHSNYAAALGDRGQPWCWRGVWSNDSCNIAFQKCFGFRLKHFGLETKIACAWFLTFSCSIFWVNKRYWITYMEHFSPAERNMSSKSIFFNNVLSTTALLTKKKKEEKKRERCPWQGCLAEPFHKVDRALPPPHCIPLNQETTIAVGVKATQLSRLRRQKRKSKGKIFKLMKLCNKLESTILN